MIHRRQYKLIGVISLFLLSGFLNLNVFGYIWANYSPVVFCEDCELRSSIDIFITEGAGCFLDSYANVLLLLNRVELSDMQNFKYKEIQEILNNAITNLEKAKSIYSSLVTSAESTSYNNEVLYKISIFDFDSFRKTYNLNPTVFNELVYYLKDGNIRGYYSRLLTDIDILTKILFKIRAGIDNEGFPKLNDLWQLNNKFAQTMLLGQYGAQMFHNLI